ncbi:MAG: hypothetical protein J5562_01590 [Clostridia bacterium]|nr:hypothetical protein [Clostridia bacterium]
MKHISKVLIALLLALLTASVMPAQVFADSLPEYICEVKVYQGSYAKAAAEGFTILTGDNGKPVDLNQGAGATGIGAKGNNPVYLGYKTTTNKDEAITDLALMNMKGGYKTKDYENLMKTQMEAQIVPLVDSLLAAVNEYRENYNSENELNHQRAVFVHDVLNKLTDDDCGGKGLGDLLLNETVYEKARPIFDALSEEEKEKTSIAEINEQVRDSLSEDERNECADILTIFAQSNGNATLILENMITRGSDTNEDLWIDRFVSITYEDLLSLSDLSPTDAAADIARLFDDDAKEILKMWPAFREHLENYDNALAILKEAGKKDYTEETDALNSLDFETSTEEEVEEAAKATVELQYSAEELANAAADVFCKEYLETIEYGNGTLLDFFMQPEAEIKKDITVLYTLVASLTEGQRAGLKFITLQDLVMFGSTDEDGYNAAAIEEMETTSVYFGVDRAIYEKGGVALTSDALRNDVVVEPTPEQSMALHIWSGIAAGLALAGAGVFIGSWVVKNSADKIVSTYNTTVKNLTDSIARQEATVMKMNTVLARYQEKGLTELAKTQTKNINSYTTSIKNAQDELKTMSKDVEYIGRMESRSSFCNNMRIGAAVFTVVMVAVTAVLLYMDYKQMKDYYHVEFTPQPRYIIEEKDLVARNESGETVILKNQSAYYKIVECNRKKGDEYFDVLGTGNDMNGDVGQQWLTLYSVKKDLMSPILASSLKVVVGSNNIPAGYKTGIHMFGSGAAFNLNNELYDWNKSAKSVFVYYQVETSSSSASTAGSTFTAGNLALAGAGGLAVGALITGIASALVSKKKRKSA